MSLTTEQRRNLEGIRADLEAAGNREARSTEIAGLITQMINVLLTGNRVGDDHQLRVDETKRAGVAEPR